MEILFKRVFSNIVLSRLIFGYSRTYKKNENVWFGFKTQLLEYEEREYINTIVYSGKEMLVKGDLPINGVLKEVKFIISELCSIKGDAIPYGVEIMQYGWSVYNKIETTPLSTLPPTIHTINDVIILLPTPKLMSSDIDIDNNNNKFYEIPSNITSISFRECPNISNGFIKIPNTIKSLEFSHGWNNQGITLSKGDIPDGVTSLSLPGYTDICKLTKGVLPNSIKDLKIITFDTQPFNFMPSNVVSLFISSRSDITPKSNLISYSSIKKLTIHLNISDIKKEKYHIHQYSLPQSITILNLIAISYTIKINTIPSNVKNLTLCFEKSNLIDNEDCIEKFSIPNSVVILKINRMVNEFDILPPSLTHLKFFHSFSHSYPQEDFIKMITILPASTISISLPKSIKNYNLTFPPSIKHINYNQ